MRNTTINHGDFTVAAVQQTRLQSKHGRRPPSLHVLARYRWLKITSQSINGRGNDVKVPNIWRGGQHLAEVEEAEGRRRSFISSQHLLQHLPPSLRRASRLNAPDGQYHLTPSSRTTAASPHKGPVFVGCWSQSELTSVSACVGDAIPALRWWKMLIYPIFQDRRCLLYESQLCFK